MKKSEHGFTHNLALLVLGVVVATVVAGAGINVYQNKNNSTASADAWRTVKYYGYGGTAYKSPAFVYPAMNAPSRGTYRACASVRSASGYSLAAVDIGTSNPAYRTISTTVTTLCSTTKFINTTGERIIPTVFTRDNNVTVFSMSVQIYGY